MPAASPQISEPRGTGHSCGIRGQEAKRLGKSLATEISPLSVFYPVEAYHQDYVRHHSDDPCVVRVSIPRLKESGLGVP